MTTYENIQNIIPIPKSLNIKYNVFDTNTLYYNIPPVIYLPDEYKYIMNYFVPKYCLSDLLPHNVILEIITNKMHRIFNHIHPNIMIMINEFLSENKSYIETIHDTMTKMKQLNNDYKFYMDYNCNIMMVLNDITIILTFNSIVFFKATMETVYISNTCDTHQICCRLDDMTLMYNATKHNFKSIVKTGCRQCNIVNIYDNMDITYDDNNKMFVKLEYHNNNTKVNLQSNTLKLDNGDYYNIYNKNGLNVTITHNALDNKTITISQCMMTGDDGLRFRGNYTETRQNDKITDKVIKKDDTILYNKENNIILVDSINNMKIRDDILIGWKAVKNEYGDWRIIKLGIYPDAMVIRPMNEEFFNTFDKERCDKAIVMDIQLPTKDEEISIISEEKQAISCIYNKKPLIYILGQEVIPDSYDNNPDNGCSNGIHFFRNRMSVFNAYIK